MQESVQVATTQAAEPMRVKDLKANGFKRAKEEFSDPSVVIPMLNYIDFMAQHNHVSADEMILPFDKYDLSKKEWTIPRKNLTGMFFDYLEHKTDRPVEEDRELPAEHRKVLEGAMNNRMEDAISRLEEEIEDAQSEAASDFSSGYAKLASIEDMSRRLKMMTADDGGAAKKMVDEFLNGIKDTNWKFLGMSGYWMEFVSRTDIILRHYEAANDRHYELNCGKFKLRLRTNESRMELHSYENCVMSGPLHPHVNGGSVCFGNAQADANAALISGDYLKIMQLLDRMLPHYGGNPYVNIHTFEARLKERDEEAARRGAQTDEEEEWVEYFEEDCEEEESDGEGYDE